MAPQHSYAGPGATTRIRRAKGASAGARGPGAPSAARAARGKRNSSDGGRRALLMGLNYRGTRAELRGCINDVRRLRQLLASAYGFQKREMTVMTDDTRVKPTKANMLRALRRLAYDTRRRGVREVWISYSGHGSYQRDRSGDERDGRDEGLCPLDYDSAGLLLDDEIRREFTRFAPGTKICCLFDCCHSGTGADLEYRYVSGTKSVEENLAKHAMRPDVIMVSGCRDNQTSADAYLSGQFQGACTNSFIAALRAARYDITVYRLLKDMRAILRSRRFTQVPQVTSSVRLSAESKFAERPRGSGAFLRAAS
jgi:hypothetical protein